MGIVEDVLSTPDLLRRWLVNALTGVPTAVAPTHQQPDGDYIVQGASGIVASNSTTTPLLAAGTFTGGWFDADAWDSIEVIVNSDQVSATAGVKIQYTDDTAVGTIRDEITRTYNGGSLGNTFRFSPTTDAFRIIYVNGGVNQTSFFLETNMRARAIEPPAAPVESEINATATANLVRNLIVLKNDLGTYGNILRSALGGLRVSIKEQEAELQQKACNTHRCDMLNVTAAVTVQLDTTKLANRKYITIANNDATKGIVYGTTAALTVSSFGIPLPAGASHQQEWDGSIDIYAVATLGTCNTSLSQSGGTV